ncbi:MAG: AgmX/PglI C-terminal domain-containing protein [Myxococcaceae bacterium]|nr:AgmX/PglI C-terminal domain-containing protein [Myxococcaceae bacterium]
MTPAPPAPEKRPIAAAVTAALTPFLGLPLALALMIGTQRHGDGGFNGLAQAWVEGGSGMYLVLFASAGIGFVCCALAFFGVSRGSGALLAAAPLSTGITATGAFMFVMGMQGAADAVVHASPADRATIMAASVGEALNTASFGFACAAALLASLALGCVFGVVAQTGSGRRVVGLSGVIFVLLAAASIASLSRINSILGLFRALASVSVSDRPTLLAAANEESGGDLGLVVVLGMLLVVVAAGAVALKETPRVAILIPVLGLGGLAGHGAYAFSLARARGLTEAVGSQRLGLSAIPGGPARDFPRRCLDETGVVSCEDRSPQSSEALGDELTALLAYRKDLGSDDTVAVGLFPGASAEGFWRFADESLRAGGNGLELVGEKELPLVAARGEFGVVAPLVRSSFTGLEVGLVEESCPGRCETGSVKNGELVVGDAVWKPGPSRPSTGDVLLAADRAWTAEQVTSLALAAAANERRLVLSLGARPATLDDEPDSALSKQAIAAVVKAKNDAIRRCYERALARAGPGLAGKVTLRWTVTGRGAVRDVRVASATLPSDSVKDCLIEQIEQLTFPAPRDGREVEINYPWVFSPAE